MNCRQLRQFLRLVGYFRNFFPRFAKLTVRLTKLLQNEKKLVAVVYTDAQESILMQINDDGENPVAYVIQQTTTEKLPLL